MSSVTDLGNGRGYVYVTDYTGVHTHVSPYGRWPVGRENTQDTLRDLRKQYFPANAPSASEGYASCLISITTAVAVNLTALTIDGVQQLGSSASMTAADEVQSAIDIADEINAHVAATDWRATSVDGVVYLQCLVAGSANNGFTPALTFSGPGMVYTVTESGGGRDSGGRPYRIFINSANVVVDPEDAVAVAANFAAATEITEEVSHWGLDSPAPVVRVPIIAGTIAFTRVANDTRVIIDGTAGGPLTSIIVTNAMDGDKLTLVAETGTPDFTVQSVTGLSLERDVTLGTGVSLDLWFSVDAGGEFIQSTASKFDSATMRANGIALPRQTGVYQLAPAAGTFTIKPGQTGVSGAGDVFEHNIGLIAPGLSPLPAALNFTFDVADAIPGDTGVVSGNGISIGLFGQPVNFTDSLGNILASLTDEMALSGLWTATWTYVGMVAGVATFNWSLIPDFSPANTEFIDPNWLIDDSIPDAKLATGIDGSKLSNDSVPEVALSPLVQAKINAQGRTTVTTTILSAAVLALNTTPVLAVAAPGAGYMIKVESVQAKITYTAPVYATNTTLQLIFSGASVSVAESATFLVKTTNAIINVPFNTTVGAGQTQLLENTALYWKVATGDPTAGASDITLYVTYSIMAV